MEFTSCQLLNCRCSTFLFLLSTLRTSDPCWLKSWDLKFRVHSVAALELSIVSHKLPQQMAAEISEIVFFSILVTKTKNELSISAFQPTWPRSQVQRATHTDVILRALMSYLPAVMTISSSLLSHSAPRSTYSGFSIWYFLCLCDAFSVCNRPQLTQHGRCALHFRAKSRVHISLT